MTRRFAYPIRSPIVLVLVLVLVLGFFPFSASSPTPTCFNQQRKTENEDDNEHEHDLPGREAASTISGRAALFSLQLRRKMPRRLLIRFALQSFSCSSSFSFSVSVQRVFSHRTPVLNQQRKTENEDDNEQEHDLPGREAASTISGRAALFSLQLRRKMSRRLLIRFALQSCSSSFSFSVSVQRVFSHRTLVLNQQRKTENEDDNEREHDFGGEKVAATISGRAALFSLQLRRKMPRRLLIRFALQSFSFSVSVQRSSSDH
jgi:hypothetical protein